MLYATMRIGNNCEYFLFQSYFRNRYIANNATTPYYANLRLRHNDNEPLIKDVLLGKINNESETVLAIIIIIYRYRNNLFHGNKAVVSWIAQKDNFIHANRFLIACLESK